MIDEFCIFERGGTVLWRRNFVALKGDPLAILVRSVLLEDRLSLPELSFDCYTLRWLLDNEKGIVFVVIFQRLLPPAYAGDLLQMVRKRFTADLVRSTSTTSSTKQTSYVVDCDVDFDLFSPTFEKLLFDAERKSMTQAKTAKATKNAPAKKRKPTGNTRTNNLQERDSEADSESVDAGLSPEDLIKKNREAFIKKHAPRRRNAGTGGKTKTKTSILDNTVSSAPLLGKKVMRPSKHTADEDSANLDFSAPMNENSADREVDRFRQMFVEATPNNDYDLDEDEEDENSAVDRGMGSVVNYFKGLAGMRNLTRNDLEPVMVNFRDSLIGKNVAQNIADRIIESVMKSLEGKRLESMTSISTTVKNALDQALTRVLTSRQSTDILSEIAAKKGTGRPFVITYCGVNGVGKSTSLAKTCFYLLQHGYKVMIAACDTFRAGAVEQLRTHVRCLGEGVELFDKGYGKDAAAVANDAIRKAKELGYDVVLVDTAGRMQDNEPLMRALSKLVEVNRPDRLFFVGEALVGNDAVDQLTKFNQALTDHQSSAKPRLIDGIVLTKFDTIDDKVGAAVSMVYSTGQPIVFVGVGQTYMDLRKLNTKSLVKALLK